MMQCDWSRAFSITTQDLDFSQLCDFYRFSKVEYHFLKPKNHTDGWTESFFKICITNLFEST